MKLTNNKRAASVVALTALSVALLGACGDGDDDAGPDDVASLDDGTAGSNEDETTDSTTPTDPEEAMLAFTECMREHGVEMDDPQVGENGEFGINLEATPENQDEIEAAQKACEPLLENATSEIELDPEREAELREQLLEYAQCMRDHGIDMPDPEFSDSGFVVQQGAEGVDPNDPDFQAADEECRGDELRPGAAEDGSGGSTSEEDG